MQATLFRSMDLTESHDKWQKVFQSFWPAYKSWYVGKKSAQINPQALKVAQAKFAHYMPELLPTYQKLVALTDHDPVAAQFLTLYQPPAYLINCSQAVLNHNEPVLMRNYDLSPDLSENLITMSNWLDQKVIATNECLWGADDGMNEAGLAVSLTFGGSQAVGDGFGIPIIMTYILHTCRTTAEAIKVLQRIPTHMAYNVTIVDRSGAHATVMVAPNQDAIVTDQRAITNHQAEVTWAAQASFSKTLERKNFLDAFLTEPRQRDELLDVFLTAPLRSTQFAQNFGTVYTAVYQPSLGEMMYAWPEHRWGHSFADFKDSSISIQLDAASHVASAAMEFDVKHVLLNALHYLPVAQSEALRESLKDRLMDWVDFGHAMSQAWSYQTQTKSKNDEPFASSKQYAPPLNTTFQRLPKAMHH